MKRIKALILSAALLAPGLRAAWNDLGPIRELGPGITPGIAVDPAGAIHVVFMHQGAIHYRRAETGQAFGAAESVPVPKEKANYSSPHLVSDASGALHLVFAHDFAANSKKAWYATRRNGKWSAPLLVFDNSAPDRRVNYPRLTTNGATVYIGAFVALRTSALAKVVNVSSTPAIARIVETPLWVAHPLWRDDELWVVGRAGAAGHQLARYTLNLDPREEPMLLSQGTTTKTGEPTAAIIDESGVVHAAGSAGSPKQSLWYTTSERALAGKDVIVGPELGEDIKEHTFPVLMRDARGRIYVSFRDGTTGESRLAALLPGEERFAEPIAIGPSITKRLRWNAHLAAAPGGGAYVVWDAGERVYFRAVGEAAGRP